MPCEEASSARWVTLRSASSAISSATSAASGVVSPGGVSCSAPTRTPSVPMLAALWPSCSKIWRQNTATEVLPLVPVTATQTSGCLACSALAARA